MFVTSFADDVRAFTTAWEATRGAPTAGHKGQARVRVLATLPNVLSGGWRPVLEGALLEADSDGSRASASILRSMLTGEAIPGRCPPFNPSATYRCSGGGKYDRASDCADRGGLAPGSLYGARKLTRRVSADESGNPDVSRYSHCDIVDVGPEERTETGLRWTITLRTVQNACPSCRSAAGKAHRAARRAAGE